MCHFELGQADSALSCFSQALALDDKHAPSYSNRANCYKGLGKYTEAEEDYSRAIGINDRNPKAFVSRAQLRETTKQVSAALADYQVVITLQPNHDYALKKVLSLALSSDETDPDQIASHRGWLHKRGHMNTTYQKRYFLLHGAMITYYEGPDGALRGKSKGEPIVAKVAHVRPSQVSELSAERASLAFSFESSEGKRFVVYAASPEDKLGWLQKLGKVVGCGHGAENRVGVEKAYADLILGGESAAASDADPNAPAAAWALIAKGARLVAETGKADEARVVLERAAASATGNAASGVYVCSQYLLGKLLASKGMHAEAAAHLSKAAESAPQSCAQIIRLQQAWSLWHCAKYAEAAATYWTVLDDDVLCWQALVDRARMHLGQGQWAQALCDLALDHHQ